MVIKPILAGGKIKGKGFLQKAGYV